MLLHYIIHRCGNRNTFGKTVLFKLLYFSDFNCFELYEKALTNESYRKLPHGPAPVHFNSAISELKKEGKISTKRKIISLNRVKYSYTSLKEPSVDFNNEELAVIDDVIDELGHMTSNRISEYSHGDMPWRATEEKEIIDYGFVFYRDLPYEKRQYNDSN